MEIQGYQFDIIHRPGKHYEIADALSRREYPTPDSQEQHKGACVSSLTAENKPSLPLGESPITQTGDLCFKKLPLCPSFCKNLSSL